MLTRNSGPGGEKVFSGTASGKLAERPELALCLGYLRANGRVGYQNSWNASLIA